MAQVRSGGHILILGGTGFLGGHLARAALAEGFRVSVFGRSKPASSETKIAEIEFDRSGELAKVVRAPSDIDVVINTLACYGRNGETESELNWVNCDLPRAIAVHYFQTENTRPRLFLNVDTALRPEVSVYSRTKATFRAELATLARSGAPMVGVRLDQFYGPLDAKTKFVTMVVHKFLDKSPAIALSGGNQARRFLFVSDAVDRLIELVRRGLNHKLHFSEATTAILPQMGIESSVRDVVLKAQEICQGQATRLDFGSLADRGPETDVRKIETGFEFMEQGAFVGIDEGIRRVVEAERQK